jgi:hypothetical protein
VNALNRLNKDDTMGRERYVISAMYAKCAMVMLIAGLATLDSSHAQQIVVHTDLPIQQIKNTAAKNLWLGMQRERLEEVRSHREKVLAALGTIERIQAQVYSTLTQVQSAVSDGATVRHIVRRIPKVVQTMGEAARLAVDRPELLPLVVREADLCQMRLVRLAAYLNETLLSNNEAVLMDPARRGELVRRVYDEVRVTEALAESMVQKLRMSRFQDVVQSVVPYRDYIQMDKQIIDGILRRWKY